MIPNLRRMRSESSHPSACPCILMVALMSACAIVPRAKPSKEDADAEFAWELALGEVFRRPELFDRHEFCITVDWPQSPRSASRSLVDQLTTSSRRITTEANCQNGWNSVSLFLSPVRRLTPNRAQLRVSYLCGPHGCYRADLRFIKSGGSWREESIAYCDEAVHGESNGDAQGCLEP